MRAGRLQERRGRVCARVRPCQPRAPRTDHAENRVRHRLDVEAVHGLLHPAARARRQAVAGRRRAEARTRTAADGSDRHPAPPPAPHERPSRLPHVVGARRHEDRELDHAGRCRAPGRPAAARQLPGRVRMAVPEHRVPAPRGNRAAGERPEPARVRGREDLQASGHGEHVLPGLAHRGDSRARHGLRAEGGWRVQRRHVGFRTDGRWRGADDRGGPAALGLEFLRSEGGRPGAAGAGADCRGARERQDARLRGGPHDRNLSRASDGAPRRLMGRVSRRPAPVSDGQNVHRVSLQCRQLDAQRVRRPGCRHRPGVSACAQGRVRR